MNAVPFNYDGYKKRYPLIIEMQKISFSHDRCYVFTLFGVLGGKRNSFRRALVRTHFLRVIRLGGTHETLCGTS